MARIRKLGFLVVVLVVGTATVAHGASKIWGVDPSDPNALVNLDPFTGAEVARMGLPAIAAADTEIGLAGWQNELFYINGSNNPGQVYVIDPDDGSQIRDFSISGGWEVDGLGYYADPTPQAYLYTSGCSVEDMHRYVAADGSGPQFFWGDDDVHDAVGGDFGGRVFAPQLVNGTPTDMIVEVDPLIDTTVGLIPCAFAPDIVGMAYDGVWLYASTVGGGLYVMDSYTGAVQNSIQLPYTLYALASTEGTGEPEPIPEPITLAGMILGVTGLAGYIRRRRAA
jgi:hypothetical protein